MTQSTRIKLAKILFGLLSIQFFLVTWIAIIFGLFFLKLHPATTQFVTFTFHSTPVAVSHATVILCIGLACFLPLIAVALLIGGLFLPVSRRVCFSMGILAHLIVVPPFILYLAFFHPTPTLILFLFAAAYSFAWWYLATHRSASTPAVKPPPLPNNALHRTEAGNGVSSEFEP